MKMFFLLVGLLIGTLLHGNAQESKLQELVNRKQFTAVIAHVAHLTKVDSMDYATMSAIGQAYEGLLRYREAYHCFKYCLHLDTTQLDAMNAIARNAALFGKVADAKRYYGMVLAVDSLNFYANHQLARLYYQLGEYGNAMEHYHQLASIEGENPAILTGLADCHLKRNTLPNRMIALSLYGRALELNPENIRISTSLINLLLQTGDPKGALQVCEQALNYNPDSRQIRQSKGMALYMTKEYVKADTVYSELLAEGDSSFLNLKYAGAARYMNGHALDGVDLLAEAFKLDSTDVETCLLYGAAIGKTYDRKRAYELFDRAEKHMQPKPFLQHLLVSLRADILRRDGRWPEAERLYYAAWKKDPTRLQFLYEINRYYWDLDPDIFQDEQRLQKTIFSRYTYLKAYMKSDHSQQYLYNYRPFLEAVCEDAFFRNAEEIKMLAPDGKQSTVSVADLRALVEKLPQMPEEERMVREQMQKQLLQNKKLQKKRQQKVTKRDSIGCVWNK